MKTSIPFLFEIILYLLENGSELEEGSPMKIIRFIFLIFLSSIWAMSFKKVGGDD